MVDRKARNIDEYIASSPENIRGILEKLRSVIKESAPMAAETISYRIPTFKLNGKNLVHFAAFKNHIGFFPTPSTIEAFKTDLSLYETSKGTIRFPLDMPMPFNLIENMVKFRVNEVLSQNKK